MAIHWLNHTAPGGYRFYEYLVLAAISGLVGSHRRTRRSPEGQ